MIFASMVLHSLAPLALVAQDLRSEAAAVASLLASPIWALKPDVLAAVPKGVSSLRWARAQLQDRIADDADDLEALLPPRSFRWMAACACVGRPPRRRQGGNEAQYRGSLRQWSHPCHRRPRLRWGEQYLKLGGQDWWGDVGS